MTLRKIAAVLALISVCTGFFACNKETEYVDVALSSSAVVSSFKIGSDDSVLSHLDSIFFSIDLVKGEIFNADSLPYGTKVDRLVPIITTLETASLIELKVNRHNASDTTYNYTSDATDSIDFTNPVIIHVVSANGDFERNYTVNVNVHKIKSDSLVWNNMSTTGLPSSLANVTAQRTVRQGNSFFCLTTDGNSYSLAVNKVGLSGLNGVAEPADVWEAKPLSLPFNPLLSSFAATDNALYMLDDSNTLWTSADDGNSWQSTTLQWENIYGGHQGILIGNLRDSDGNWMLQTFPEMNLTPLPDGMPVSGTSVPVLYNFPMSQRPQSMIVGGRKADGSLSASSWGFDGNSWVKISKRDLPEALEDAAVAPYYSFTVSEGWSVKEFATMLVFGGRKADGALSGTVYMSNDYGYNWTVADDHLQLPAEMPPFISAQAYVMASTFSASVVPAIVKPIESWECPYIYIFGGTNAQGILFPTIWRGVINRLTFKPIE